MHFGRLRISFLTFLLIGACFLAQRHTTLHAYIVLTGAAHVAPQLRFITPSPHKMRGPCGKNVPRGDTTFSSFERYWEGWLYIDCVCVSCGGRCVIAPLLCASDEAGIGNDSFFGRTWEIICATSAGKNGHRRNLIPWKLYQLPFMVLALRFRLR